MPRYFFDVAGGLDEIGTELPEPASAKIEALRLMGELLRDNAEAILEGLDYRVLVRRQDGLPLAQVQTVVAPAMSAPSSYLRQAERRQA